MKSNNWPKLPKHNLIQPTLPTFMVSPVAGLFYRVLFLTMLNTIQQHLIPALTGPLLCSMLERELLALPALLGGLGIVKPTSTLQHVFEASVKLTSTLVATITTQIVDQPVDISEVMKIKTSIRQSNHEDQTRQAKHVYALLPHS